MANLDQTHANDLLSASLGKATLPATVTPLKQRLMNSTGAVPTGTVVGTEITGGSYPAGGIDISTSVLPVPTAGSSTSGSAVNYTGMPAVTVNAIEEWDSSATPKRKWFGTITSKTTNAGDTLSFAAGALSFSLA